MEEIGEFQDWEILQNLDTGVDHSPEVCKEFDDIEGDYESVIRLDYFSIDSDKKYTRRVTVEEQSSVDSYDPCLVDPFWESGYEHTPKKVEGFDGIVSACKNLGEFGSESSCDGPISRKFVDFGGKQELGIEDDLKVEMGLGGIGEIHGIEANSKDSGDFLSDSGSERSVSQKFEDFGGIREFDCENNLNKENIFQVVGEIQRIEAKSKDSSELLSDSGSERSVSQKFEDFGGIQEFDCEDNLKKGVIFQGVGEIQGTEIKNNKFVLQTGHDIGVIKGEGQSGIGDFDQMGDGSDLSSEVETANGSALGVVGVGVEGGSCEELKSGEEGKREMVWWKLPFELIKFSVFRISPVWTFSIAAAVMGFLILKRRLYKAKRKSRSIPLKITVEDKKVSQFMIRATRLNEAFSVVRRVPIIRSSLPAVGVTPWPLLS